VRDPVRRHAVPRYIAALPTITDLVRHVLGKTGKIVRSVLFDKTPDSNWDVAWHQDVTIAVQEKHTVPGFGPWSVKGGVVCVQPPAEVLEGMLTIRLHLDECSTDNGPLLAVPGSHRHGILAVQNLDLEQCERDAVACTAGEGAAVLMRPLTLHASRKSQIPRHRRVLHLDFAANPLPEPLKWQADL
jgi:ectoine hydroxylase-related dioxygenase (phytanoyl-CoA dioxygenase family)